MVVVPTTTFDADQDQQGDVGFVCCHFVDEEVCVAVTNPLNTFTND